jgi:hypothetical protein
MKGTLIAVTMLVVTGKVTVCHKRERERPPGGLGALGFTVVSIAPSS